MTGLDLLHVALPGHDAFVVRAVRYLAADVGVRQFLDVGSGISAGPMLHAVVHQIIPTARVLYVTDDPDVLARIDDRQDGNGPVEAIKADPTDPAAVLEHAGAALDLTAPVAVLLTGVLHLVGAAEADRIVAGLVDAVVTESHVVVSHLARDVHPGEMDALQRQLNDTTAEAWTFRSFEQVRALYAGLDLVEPGVVLADEWRPTNLPHPPLLADGWTNPVWVGIGSKP